MRIPSVSFMPVGLSWMFPGGTVDFQWGCRGCPGYSWRRCNVVGLYVYIEMLSHEPCHAHTLPSIGQRCFGCFVCKYFWMFSFHIPLSRICFSPICGRRGWYARPRGVVVAGSLAGHVFFVAGGWPGGCTRRGAGRPAALRAGDRGGAGVVTNG